MEFPTFNLEGIETALPYLAHGGAVGTFIDWRGLKVVQHAAAGAGLKAAELDREGKEERQHRQPESLAARAALFVQENDGAHANSGDPSRGVC